MLLSVERAVNRLVGLSRLATPTTKGIALAHLGDGRRETLAPVTCTQASTAAQLVFVHQVGFYVLTRFKSDCATKKQAPVFLEFIETPQMIATNSVEFAVDVRDSRGDQSGESFKLDEAITGDCSSRTEMSSLAQMSGVDFSRKERAIDKKENLACHAGERYFDEMQMQDLSCVLGFQ